MAGTQRKSQKVLSTKVFVGYLPDTVKKKEITQLFEDYGEIVECDIVKDFAFVHFKSIGEAKAAVKALDGTDFKGRQLHVQISISKVRQKAGMGDIPGCYRCGSHEHWSRYCPDNSDGPNDWADLPPPPRGRMLDIGLDDPLLPPRPLSPPRPLPMVLRIPPEYRHYYEDTDPLLRPPPEYYKYKKIAERDPFGLLAREHRPLPPL